MAKLPLEPSLARALIASKELGCVKEMIGIVSLLSASSKLFFDVASSEEREAALVARSKFFHHSGDHMTLLNVFRAFDDVMSNNVAEDTSGDDEKDGPLGKMDRRSWCKRQYINDRALNEAVKIREQIQRACVGAGMDTTLSSGDDPEPILHSLCRGLFHNTALKHADGSYKTANTVRLANCAPKHG